MTTTSYPHYIFGYGSLLCPTSRAVTAPSLQDRSATPVRVFHFERVWSLPYKNCRMTFMGIRRKPQATCVGVLVPVTDEELAQFDVRELGYDRVKVEHDHVEPYHQQDSSSPPDCYFARQQQAQPLSQPPTIWVYLQQAEFAAPVNSDCPLAQTYVDIILRGCLTISNDFVQEFLINTRGWTVQDYYFNQDEGSDKQPKEKVMTTFWVNDRHNPIYKRADVEYSQTYGPELDQLLQAHRPELIHRRPHRDG